MRPLLKAAFSHPGTAVLDIISPCVTFADHEGSTKSYAYVKEHDAPIHSIDFVPYFEDIHVDYAPGTTREVKMPDGSSIYLQKLDSDYDPTSREGALDVIHRSRREQKIATGLLFVDPEKTPFATEELSLVEAPLAGLPLEQVRPPRRVLDQIMDELKTGKG
jgi:2-oxoglutarate ferredoxin oxidoreductase subunit beta